jgi:predicted Zn-dependent protease
MRITVMRRVRSLPVLACLFALPVLCQDAKKDDAKKDPDQIGSRDVSKGINLYSIPKEIALGKQLAAQVLQTNRLVDDPVISEYVNRLCQNLARNSDAKIPVTSSVIQGESINALTLPGGYMFVNTGLILAADTESELAGALAHEIGHVAARHGTRQASREQVANLATIPLIFMGGGWGAYGTRQAAGVLMPAAFLSFSREFESEADLLGLQYLYKAGYDPGGFVDIFEKIQSLNRSKPGLVARFFSDHPQTADRISTAQKNIQGLLREQPQYVVTTSEFDQVKARLLALENRRKSEPEDQTRPRLRTPASPRLSKSLKSGNPPCV